MKSSWHHESRRYAWRFIMNPYASTFERSSAVKMARYTHSHTSMKAALRVPSGSRGDSHAIVKQLHMMVTRIRGSK